MRLVFCLPLVFLPLPSLADTFELSPQVAAALVTGDGGVVTYDAKLSLGSGRHTLNVRLPSGLADEITVTDIRLPDGLTLIAQNAAMDRAAPRAREYTAKQRAARDARIAAERALDDHRKALAELSGAVAAADARRTLAEATARSGLAGGDVLPSVEQIGQIADALSETVRSAALEIAALNVEIAKLAPRTADLEEQLRLARAAEQAAIPAQLQASGVLSLQVEAAASLDGAIQIDTVENVIWSPVYTFDLNQEGEAGSLVITRQAEVAYFTNSWREFSEPLYAWDAVDITLSTAKLGEQTQTWEPNPIIQRLVDKAERKRIVSSYAGSSVRESVLADSAPEPMVEVTEEEARSVRGVSHFGQTVVFNLGAGQRLDLFADRTRFDIDQITAEVDLYALANAARDRHAFLYTDLKNTTGGVLLAGSGLLTRDGTVIGTIGVPTLLPEQEEPLGLGPLYGLRLDRSTLNVQEGDRGLISSRSEEEWQYSTVIESALNYSIYLHLLDVVPTSESEDLVIRMSAQPRPVTEARDGKRGVLEWVLPMAPGATETVTFGYRAQWPTDKIPVVK